MRRYGTQSSAETLRCSFLSTVWVETFRWWSLSTTNRCGATGWWWELKVCFVMLLYFKCKARKPSCGAGAQSVTVKSTGCGFDPNSRRWNIYLHFYFYFFALVSRQRNASRTDTAWSWLLIIIKRKDFIFYKSRFLC